MKKLVQSILIIGVAIQFTSCEKALLDAPVTDKKEVFNYLWKSVDEKYSFFELKNIDWDAIHSRFEPGISNAMTDKQFFDTLAVMLDLLQDGHTGITSPFDDHKNSGVFSRGPENLNVRLIADHYSNGWGHQKGSLRHIPLADGQIGYVYYGDFSDIVTDSDMDYILNEYKDTKGLIIDIRGNTGGSADNIFKLAKRFAKNRTLVFRSVLKNGPEHNNFTEPTETWLEPAANIYTGKVCVLTNRKVFSAASVFTLTMRELPNVTVVGDTTGGGLGLPIGTELPNGWQVHFSGSQLFTPDGICYEMGIPPDVQVDMNKDDENKGIDSIIEKAIKVILE